MDACSGTSVASGFLVHSMAHKEVSYSTAQVHCSKGPDEAHEPIYSQQFTHLIYFDPEDGGST
jgi:hypothetical protein